MFAPTQLDSYKVGHPFQYPPKTQMVYSNFTCRGSRIKGVDETVFFGLQYYMLKYLTDDWNKDFFDQPKEDVIARYKRRMDTHLGPDSITVTHLEKLHDLGYMPISIRALPEGTIVPIRVPMLTIRNLDGQILTNRDGTQINGDEFFWVTNMLETSLSNSIWFPIVNATKALNNRKIIEKWADKTCMTRDFVPFQNHDFSMRGHQCMEAAAISGAAHILSSVGSDTISGIDFLESYYQADASKEMISVSVPATEHSVMCAGGSHPDEEQETFRRLIQDQYPSGIVSIVSDTWDLWNVTDVILPNLKDIIMQRNGKVVCRPDCYDDQTQILTNSGWKFFENLNENDLVAQVHKDNTYDFVKPSKIVNEEYDGPMVHFKDYHGKMDQMVTPNHRVVWNKNNSTFIQEAQDCGHGYHNKDMWRSARNTSVDYVPLSPEDQLRIAFQADGSFPSHIPEKEGIISGTKSIRFNFAKQRKIDRLVEILDKCSGVSYKITEEPARNGQKTFEIKLPLDFEISKTFDWVDQNVNYKWAREFIEEVSHWDSSRRSDTRFKFDTTDENVVKVVYDIGIQAGYGVHQSKYIDDRKSHFNDTHTLHILKNNLIGGQSIKKEDVVNYQGSVHCVTVPSGMLLLKRNKSTFVSGNSGNPVDIICGTEQNPKKSINGSSSEKGLVERLWDIFGGTVNEKGYKTLDAHIGAIYGDGINDDRMEQILSRLEKKGFASDNVVFGIGSFTYSFGISRDTFNAAIKSVAVKINGVDKPIFKDPATDSGIKKSAKGFCSVLKDENGNLYLKDQVTREESENDEMTEVFNGSKGGVLIHHSLSEIRERMGTQFQ